MDLKSMCDLLEDTMTVLPDESKVIVLDTYYDQYINEMCAVCYDDIVDGKCADGCERPPRAELIRQGLSALLDNASDSAKAAGDLSTITIPLRTALRAYEYLPRKHGFLESEKSYKYIGVFFEEYVRLSDDDQQKVLNKFAKKANKMYPRKLLFSMEGDSEFAREVMLYAISLAE